MKRPKLFHLFLVLNICFFISFPPRHTLGNFLTIEAIIESKELIITAGAMLAAAGKAIINSFSQKEAPKIPEVAKPAPTPLPTQSPVSKQELPIPKVHIPEVKETITTPSKPIVEQVAVAKPAAIATPKPNVESLKPDIVKEEPTITLRPNELSTQEELKTLETIRPASVKWGTKAGEIIDRAPNQTRYPVLKSEHSSAHLDVTTHQRPSIPRTMTVTVKPPNLRDFTKRSKEKLHKMSTSYFKTLFNLDNPWLQPTIKAAGGEDLFVIQQFNFWQFRGFRDYIRSMPEYKSFIYQAEKEVLNRATSTFANVTKDVPGFKCKRKYPFAFGVIGSKKDKYGFHEYIKSEAIRLREMNARRKAKQIEDEAKALIEATNNAINATQEKRIQWLNDQQMDIDSSVINTQILLDEDIQIKEAELEEDQLDELALSAQTIRFLKDFKINQSDFTAQTDNVLEQNLQENIIKTLNDTSELTAAFIDDFYINNISLLIYDFAKEAIVLKDQDIRLSSATYNFCNKLLDLGEQIGLELNTEEFESDLKFENYLEPLLAIRVHKVNQTDEILEKINEASIALAQIPFLYNGEQDDIFSKIPAIDSNLNLEFKPIEDIVKNSKDTLELVNEYGLENGFKIAALILASPAVIEIHGSIKEAAREIAKYLSHFKKYEEAVEQFYQPTQIVENKPRSFPGLENPPTQETKKIGPLINPIPERKSVTPGLGTPPSQKRKQTPELINPIPKPKSGITGLITTPIKTIKTKLFDLDQSKKKSLKKQIKDALLPTKGKIRFVPSKKSIQDQQLKRVIKNGNAEYQDKFKNWWREGGSKTLGEPHEWDVQLSNQGKQQLGWASRSGHHINVSLKGRITHAFIVKMNKKKYL